MKKIFYIIATVLAGAMISGCEADPRGGRGDVEPIVMIRSLTLRLPVLNENAEPIELGETDVTRLTDSTLYVRMTPNSLTSRYYVLALKQVDRNAFEEENGLAALIDKVVAEGQVYDREYTLTERIVSGQTETFVQSQQIARNILLRNIGGIYSICVVARDQNDRNGPLAEYVFNGNNWLQIGTGVLTDSNWPEAADGTVLPRTGIVIERSEGKDMYRLLSFMAENRNFNFTTGPEKANGNYSLSAVSGTTNGLFIDYTTGLQYPAPKVPGPIDDEDDPVDTPEETVLESLIMRINLGECFFNGTEKKLVLRVAPFCSSLGIISTIENNGMDKGFNDMVFQY